MSFTLQTDCDVTEDVMEIGGFPSYGRDNSLLMSSWEENELIAFAGLAQLLDLAS